MVALYFLAHGHVAFRRALAKHTLPARFVNGIVDVNDLGHGCSKQ